LAPVEYSILCEAAADGGSDALTEGFAVNCGLSDG
jgi:hypothetical protein